MAAAQRGAERDGVVFMRRDARSISCFGHTNVMMNVIKSVPYS
jgi:hypothetical protein